MHIQELIWPENTYFLKEKKRIIQLYVTETEGSFSYIKLRLIVFTWQSYSKHDYHTIPMLHSQLA